MSAATRNPTGTGKSAFKLGGAVSVVGLGIGYLWPQIEMMDQQLITGAVITVSGFIGKEVRNYQHTFSSGQKRAGQLQNGLAEGVLNLLGNVL